MKSSDPAIAKTARDSLMTLMTAEMPTIEKDTKVLCTALTDSDSYIRLQATAILQAIVVAAPSHAQTINACTKELVGTAADPVDRVRNNSLFILAMDPLGTPIEAHDAFVHSLASTNFRTSELGAAGLLKEQGAQNASNQKLIEDALTSAPDDKHRLNLLYAIAGSGVPSESLFQVGQKFIYDPNPQIQEVAIDAVAATATDRAKLASTMQNLAGSTSTSPSSKQHAQAVLNRIENPQ